MTDAPELEPAALEAQFRARFKDGRLAPYPLWDYWVAVDGKTGDLGYEWSDKPHRLVFDLLHHAVALEKALSAARSTVPEAGKAVVKPLEWENAPIPPCGEWGARSVVGLYCIPLGATEFLLKLRDKYTVGVFDTVESAKAAAQADYEQRILSALASYPAPTGAEPVAWMVLRKDNLHLPVLTSREDADKYQRFNPEETLQPLYAYPQPVAPTGKTAGLVERLNERAASYRLGGPSSEHTASMLDEAAAALTASEAEAADLRRKLEEAREALEVIAASDDIENALDPARNKRVAARTLSGASE